MNTKPCMKCGGNGSCYECMSEGWKQFTPTYTSMVVGKRTFWQWLLRKPRPKITLPTPTGLYKQEGKTVYIQYQVNVSNAELAMEVPKTRRK